MRIRARGAAWSLALLLAVPLGAVGKPAYGGSKLLVVTDSKNVDRNSYSQFWASLEGDLRPRNAVREATLMFIWAIALCSSWLLAHFPRHQERKSSQYRAADALRGEAIRRSHHLRAVCQE